MEQKDWDKEKGKIIAIYMLSFLLPVTIMMLILNSIGISYNGKLTLLTHDMKLQYMPFITELRYLIADPRKLLFNWNNSLGGNYMGVFAYYMASPLNLITQLWSIKDIPKAIYVLYIVKIGLAGFHFNIFLHRKHKDMEIRVSNIVFATCYALMSFAIADGISIIWLDAVLLLPLVLLGVDRICEGKKGGLFLAGYAMVLFTNFYMAYMVGIFAFLYFCAEIVLKYSRREWKRAFSCAVCFAGNTALAFGLIAPIWIPTLLNAKYSQAGRQTKSVIDVAAKTNCVELFKQFLPGQYPVFSLYNDSGKPFVFCGSIFLILVPLFFIQKRNRKEKIAVLFLGMSVLLGFLIPPIDYVWHGFRNPAGFPYRYAYLFSCFAIMTGYEAWIRMKWKISQVFAALLAVYTIVELYINGTVIIAGIERDRGYDERSKYESYYRLYEPFMKELQSLDEDGFYREKEEVWYDYNLASIYGRRGTDFFASTYYNRVKLFLNYMGSEKDQTGVRVTMQGCTPLLDSLMGVRYALDTSNPLGMYEEKMNFHGGGLYENPDALSLGYLVSQDTSVQEPQFGENVFANQYWLMQYLGIPDSHIYAGLDCEINYEKDSAGADVFLIRFIAPAGKGICFYLDAETGFNNTNMIYLDGEFFQDTNQIDTRRIYGLPPLTEGEEHEIKIVGSFTQVQGFYLCEFDRKAYKEEIALLQKNQMQVISCDGNHIFCRIESEEDGLLFVTLPYDEGYTVLVDGQKVQTQAALDTFLSFQVTGGSHMIEIVYFPPGLKAGIAAMVLAIILAVGYYGVLARKEAKNAE